MLDPLLVYKKWYILKKTWTNTKTKSIYVEYFSCHCILLEVKRRSPLICVLYNVNWTIAYIYTKYYATKPANLIM